MVTAWDVCSPNHIKLALITHAVYTSHELTFHGSFAGKLERCQQPLGRKLLHEVLSAGAFCFFQDLAQQVVLDCRPVLSRIPHGPQQGITVARPKTVQHEQVAVQQH